MKNRNMKKCGKKWIIKAKSKKKRNNNNNMMAMAMVGINDEAWADNEIMIMARNINNGEIIIMKKIMKEIIMCNI